MFNRLLHVIAILIVIILIGYFYEILKPVPFPNVEGIGKIDPEAPNRFSYSEDGIKYRVLRKGNGKFPKDSDMVVARIRQTLPSGEVFSDNLVGKDGKPFRVVKAPLIGIKKIIGEVSEGGLIQAVLPPSMAYGKRGHRAAKTPNNSPIHVLLVLDEVQDSYEATEFGPVDDDAPKEYSETKTGLKYKILRKSDGPKPDPDKDEKYVIHYKLSIKDGEEIESSFENGFAAVTTFDGNMSFTLNTKWFTGFREGLQLIGSGGMIELEIPPELGFADTSKPNIPANSTLHMVIELMEIRDSQEKSIQPVDNE